MSAILEVQNVNKEFTMGGIFSRKKVHAVMDASFSILEGEPEVFTIVGESGSGKTTLARMILGLETVTSGSIRVGHVDVTQKQTRTDKLTFMRHIQPVFQNPFEAFNPLKEVDRYLESTARVMAGLQDKQAIDEAMDAALQKVGLSLVEIRGRFSHELSGGQLQRVAIARALIPEPSILVADEPVSMVDASLRMSIVNLLRDLRDQFGVTVLYITHDLATAYYVSDRIMIMQKGKIVEMGPAQIILENPEHPYTKLLKDSVLSVQGIGESEIQPADHRLAEEAERISGTGVMTQREDGRFVRLQKTS